MQGWLFSSNSAFWTNDRVEAYLGGVTVDSDLLILDLASESLPQWQRTDSYFGKPWIWCQIHDYGGNMGFYGQVMNITVNPIAALNNATSSLVGFGLSMEGQEGNEIVYDLLLDQAWSATPIDTATYFHDWVTARYAGSKSIPTDIYNSWDILRTTVYNNTNLTSNAVPKAIFELIPSTSGLVNRTGHHPTTINYNPADMVKAWSLFYNSASKEPSLWLNPAYEFDLVDMSRQVLANAFIPVYQDLVAAWNTTTPSTIKIQCLGAELIGILEAADTILSTNQNFKLSTWINSARTSAGQQDLEKFLEYDAINQITLWGPAGQISDYASKSWAGLVSSYYIPRWQKFIEYLLDTSPAQYNQTAFKADLLNWELQWQNDTIAAAAKEGVDDKVVGDLEVVLEGFVGAWKNIFSA
jgi:alpha-N-acetylglucosaminidase